MSRKPSKPETRIEDYLDVMTGGNAALPQPILRIEFYYAFLAGMAVELPQPILDDEKLLAKICGMEVEAPTYIPGLFPRLYAYMAKKGGQDVQVPDPILRLERYWYDYSAGSPPSVQEYTGAVPVTFVADGTPLLDYLISGNTVQSGTPTPDSPVMPQGTGERTGNLFASIWEQGSINGTTGQNEVAGTLVRTKDYIPIKPNIPYSFSRNIANGYMNLRLYRADKSYIGSGSASTIRLISGTSTGNPMGTRATFCCFEVIDSEAAYIRFNDSSNNTATKWHMVEGEYTEQTMPEYQPYGIKIPILSADTTTNIYLGEVETTRKIKKLVFDGTELWNRSTFGNNTRVYTPQIPKCMSLSPAICTHFDYNVANVGYPRIGEFVINSSKAILFGVDGNTFADVDAWKAYLADQYAAGTPVTVWYVLSNLETAVVNEPLMRIGDYSDTLSMEQAGVSIPTANGSTTLDVETTVKPSEIYIKYRGEAVATLSTLSAEVSSPEETPEEVNPEETEEEENER